MFEVIILRVIPELTRDDYNILLSLISLKKREQVNRFYFFRDAQMSLLGDILTRVELCRVTGLSNSELEFAVNSYGKPFLVNVSCVHYNIAHAGQYIACVIGDVSVGVDIELVKPFDMRVVERFFMSDEQAYVLSSQGDLRNERFFEVWTKKESRIKLEGRALLESLSSFSVLDSCVQHGVFYHCIYNNDKTIGYVCSSKEEMPTVKVIDTHMLLRQVNLVK